MTLHWVNIRQAHVAKGYVYLPDDQRKLRLRISRLFSRCEGNHTSRREKGYLIMVEDPSQASLDTFNFQAERTSVCQTLALAKAEAERLVSVGEVLLAPSPPVLASVHPAL